MRLECIKWLSLSVLLLILINNCTDKGVDPSVPGQLSIKVISPGAAGATWYANVTYSIIWNSSEGVGNLVTIDLYNDTAKIQTIVTETPNDGLYSWTLPLSIISATGYRIKITSGEIESVYSISGSITIINNCDEYEPDDNAALATLIDTSGTLQYHTISKNDVDWLKFNATNERTYLIHAKGSAYPILQLYAPDGITPVVESGNVGTDSNATAIWTCTNSGIYYCRITSTQSDSLLPYSVNACASNAILTIVSPDSGSIFDGGTSIDIVWVSSTNTGNHVSLYLYRDTALVDTIGKTIYNSGSCSWTIPYNLSISSNYRIKIVSSNDTSLNEYSNYFTINKPTYSLMVTTPDISTQWNTGTENIIYWSSTGTFEFSVNLDLYDSVTYLGTIAQNINKSIGSYSWRVPSSLQTSKNYRIRISNPGDTLIYDFSDYFTINYIPSSLNITTPTTGANWETGTLSLIQWNYSGNAGNFLRLDLYDSISLVTNIVGGTATTQKEYTWAIPPSIATGPYRLKITCVEDTTLSGFSEFFTITKIPASITVLTPCSTDVWDVISTYAINWSFLGMNGSAISIDLYNDSTMETTVTSNTAVNDSNYSWSLPSDLAGGDKYRIKITCNGDSTVYDYSDYFTIIPIPNRITVTSPATASQWNTGTTNSIRWTYTLNPGPYVKIELYDSSIYLQTIDSSVATSSQVYSWTVPSDLDSSELYQIKVSSTTIDSVFDYSDTFTIVFIPSGINITTPTTGTNWTAGSSYTIYWNSVGNVPGNYVSIHLYDSTTWTTTIDSDVSLAGGSYRWTIPSTITGGNRCRIKIVSTTDTTVDGYSNYFTITEQPKRLTVTVPTNNTLWKAGENNSIYWTYVGSPGPNVKIELYDSSLFVHTVTASVKTTNGTYLWLVPTSLKTGSGYQIKVSSTTIDTVFDFSETFTIENAVITDQYEPDSVYTLATLIAKDGPVQTHALSPDDLDWLTFEAVSATTYTIVTGGTLDTYLNLFSTNGTTLLTSDDDSGTDLNATIVWECTTTGTYYFRVHGNFKGRGPRAGYYTVSIR